MNRWSPLSERDSAKKKKARRSCEPPDFYREWVSKHNPYTILKRIFPSQNFSLKFFNCCGENVDSVEGVVGVVGSWRSCCRDAMLASPLEHPNAKRPTIPTRSIPTRSLYQSFSIFTGLALPCCILSCTFRSSCCNAFSRLSACCSESLLGCGCGRCFSLSSPSLS